MVFKETELFDLVKLFGGEISFFELNRLPQHLPQGKYPLLGFQTLEKANKNHIGFLSNPKYREQLLTTQACVVLVQESNFHSLQAFLQEHGRTSNLPLAWRVSNPYIYYAKIQQWWVAQSEPPTIAGIHPTALVDTRANVHASASIGAHVVVGPGSQIHEGVRIEAGVVLGREVQVGAYTRIYPNVTVYDECQIGAHCILHAGAVIGADGFGFAHEHGNWVKIPQVGRVLIADEVEIGANTTIDRGALDDTLIGFGVKLDNQIQIGHNVQIGEATAIAACTGIAGSARIGARCSIGGAVSVLGHLSIAEGTQISPVTTVLSTIKEPGVYTGIFPIDTHKAWEKTAVSLKQIVKLRADVRELKNNKS